MKRICTKASAILLIFVLLLSLTACGWTTSATDSSSGNGTSNAGDPASQAALADIRIEDGQIVAVYADGTTRSLGAANTYITNNDIDITSTAGQETAVAASRAIMSVVGVQCHFSKTTVSWPWGQESTQEYYSFGSGVIYQLDKQAGDAYIITNHHVVYDAASDSPNGISTSIGVYLLGDMTVVPATYVGGSPNYDIAVLRVTGSAQLSTSVAQAATLSGREPTVGESVFVIGNPEAEGISVTAGIVSVDSEHLEMESVTGEGTVDFRVMRVDAAVNSGNSGGGLFDAEGRLHGIVNAKVVDTEVENIGYAIPANVAVAVAQNIIDASASGCTCVRRAMLGMTIQIADSKLVYDSDTGLVHIEETVKVAGVTNGGLAQQMGIAVEDILRSVKVGDRDTLTITRQHHLIDELLNARVGDTVTVVVSRGGADTTLTVVITEGALSDY